MVMINNQIIETKQELQSELIWFAFEGGGENKKQSKNRKYWKSVIQKRQYKHTKHILQRKI